MSFKDTKEGQTHYQNDNCGEPQHNDTTPLQKEIELFRKQFPYDIFVSAHQDWTCGAIELFLRQSLLRFTKSVIEEAMPEEKTEDNDRSFYIDYDRKKGWNDCRTKFKKNAESILKDNEKEV